MFLVIVVCCPVEVFAKGRSLAQRSVTDYMYVIGLIGFNNIFLHLQLVGRKMSK